MGTKELPVGLSAVGKSEFGLCGVVGGKMVIELLAGTMRRGRGGIVAVEDMRQTYTVKHIRKGLILLSSKMQISERTKLVWSVVSCVAITITLIVAIDKLNFVARWLLHIEPYKDNIERIIYAGIFVFLVLRYVNRIIVAHYGKGVKALKVRVPGFGFEIEFNDDNNVGNHNGDVLAHKIDGGNSNQTSCGMQYSSIAERKIFSILKSEMHLEFSPNATLIRGGCRYAPDGFAIKNGRAYIVEVKTMYRPGVIDGTIAQLKTFAEMVQETKISRVTVILCVVTDHPIAYFAEKIKGVNLGEETEFIFRVFTPEQLERIEDVVS